MAQNWAIVIGINEYEFLQPLKYAQRDAEVVSSFLAQEAGFDRIFLFTDNSPAVNGKSTEPSRANLLRVLRQVFKQPFMKDGDNFWFFFSGHGIRYREQDYLMPLDGDPEDVENTGISTHLIANYLRSCGADNTVMILDACRSEGKKSGEGIGRQTEADARQTGVISVFSCSPEQYSYEIEAIGQGAFTFALLEGLGIRGRCATVERLNQYLSSRVPELVTQHLGRGRQMPYTIAEPIDRTHLILMPQYASLADITTLKNDAYRAQTDEDWDLAERLWIRVLAAASGQDMDAIGAIKKIAVKRSPIASPPQSDILSKSQDFSRITGNPEMLRGNSLSKLTPQIVSPSSSKPPTPRNNHVAPLTPIQIHEFSSGIHIESRADGSWVSKGYTGKYMNATLEVPSTVQHSIKNKEFAVFAGVASNKPALIGRVVSGSEESDWSVIATVVIGKDDYNRSCSLYRYFLVEGGNHLDKILAWMENEWQNGRSPTFNPFDRKAIGQPNNSDIFAPQIALPAECQSFLNESPPTIIPPQFQWEPQLIHKLAVAKAEQTGQLVAWAVNVEVLEQLGRFQVIQPASEEAYQRLQRSVVVEQALISAIMSLSASTSTIKSEQVQIFAKALENSTLTPEYWKTVFDGCGASQALKQGIYSFQMVRLLTLQAITLPDTLPDYLLWLKLAKKPHKKDSSHPFSLSEAFQSQLRPLLKSFSQIQENIFVGNKIALLQFLQQALPLDTVLWLFSWREGVWSSAWPKLARDIFSDLETFQRVFLSHPDAHSSHSESLKLPALWHRDFWLNYRHNPYSLDPYYKPLADLLLELKEYRLAAYFYQVAEGVVPTPVFASAFGSGRNRHVVVGVEIVRQITLLEKFALLVRRYDLFLLLLILGGVTVTGIAFWPAISSKLLPRGVSDSPQNQVPPLSQPAPSSPNKNGSASLDERSVSESKPFPSSISSPDTITSLPEVAPDIIEQSVGEYNSAIEKIKTGIGTTLGESKSEDEINQAIGKVLKLNQFSSELDQLSSGELNEEKMQSWFDAVRAYQENKKKEGQLSEANLQQASGKLGPKTRQLLVCDVLEELKSTNLPAECLQSSTP